MGVIASSNTRSDRHKHRTETTVRQKAITVLTRNHSPAPSAGTKANHFDLNQGGNDYSLRKVIGFIGKVFCEMLVKSLLFVLQHFFITGGNAL